MAEPRLSAHFATRQPSVIRLAQIEFAKRNDDTEDLNVAIGNVSLPMHPAMQERMRGLDDQGSPFAEGVVKYSATPGFPETNAAILNIIASSGFDTAGLSSQITDGGSQAMELVIVGCCGPAGTKEKPLLLIDAAYTNYTAFAERLGRATVSITRELGEDGSFSLPSAAEIEETIREHKPGAMVVIPYDNPTGQLYDRQALVELARLCVKHGLWLISDEAYRELYYTEAEAVSVWGLTEQDVPGITGCRISIETSSKVWNACGLRIGALVTDNQDFHARAVAENTAGLCSNVIGQYIFAGLADQSHEDLRQWYTGQREYYRAMLREFTSRTRDLLPGIIVSRPDASIYSVVDVRNIVAPDFDALDFVLFCARKGNVDVAGRPTTLLTAPMAGFYSVDAGAPNPGRTQMRIAYVETPERMKLVPDLLAGLLEQYQAQKA
ncbi:MAG: aminotransferase class I/II-fold pyridoxal phosphate-dependent enzyme [Candidatus Krumholzibacteria bacterium]|nr:aminotransferase class I/II-fold pyridoxal phosphate-dependent enzyme [Candidatus Krumholzibacteria bacterium]